MRLIHYTRTPEAVAVILLNGFAYVANRRKLAEELPEVYDFRDREPQQFGMVSFQACEETPLSKHLERFGGFAICVTNAWATRNNAQPVLYVDRGGPVFEALRDLFVSAYTNLRNLVNCYPGDRARAMAYHNKNVAGLIGADAYAALLQIYEYIEPIENQYQAEWRVVNPNPNYSISEDRRTAMGSVSPPKGWTGDLNRIAVSPAEIDHLLCPEGRITTLRALIPDTFRNVVMKEFRVE